MESSRVTLDRCPVCGDLVQRGAGCQRCENGRLLSNSPAEVATRRRRLPISARTITIVVLLIALLAGGMTVWSLSRSRSEDKPPANSQQATLSLGELPSVMPQSEEATLLLALVTREPGKTLYEIDYHAGGSTIAFAYSPGDDTLTREQRAPTVTARGACGQATASTDCRGPRPARLFPIPLRAWLTRRPARSSRCQAERFALPPWPGSVLQPATLWRAARTEPHDKNGTRP